MRSILCVIAIVACTSEAGAQPQRTAGAFANFVTERNEVDIEFWTTLPLNLETDWISLLGKDAVWSGNSASGLAFRFSNGHPGHGGPNDPLDHFHLVIEDPAVGQRTVYEDVPYQISERMEGGKLAYIVSATFSADQIRLSEMIRSNDGITELYPNQFFVHSTMTAPWPQINSRVTTTRNGHSTVDGVGGLPTDPVVPEPSSIALASLAAVGLIVHRFRRLRQLDSRTT